MPEVTCPRCSHRNPLGSNFCSSCGQALGQHPEETATMTLPSSVWTDAEPEPAVDELGEVLHPGVLVVTRGTQVGARLPLDKTRVTLGRHPDSVIFLDDVAVSRRHAEIDWVDGRYRIHDVGSLNGTYLNRERVEEAWLKSGDEIQLGKFKLVFVAREGDEDG